MIIISDVLEIRWHGRGGQGAKTASLLLADAAFAGGKYVQGFPEYGPERMGAPVTAYNRISDKRITLHSNIYKPDYVAVVDETLIGCVQVTAGLKPDGALIVNSRCEPKRMRERLKDWHGRMYIIDARSISEQCLGKYFPNTPMLGAVVKVSKCVALEEFIANMQKSYEHKFASKPQVIEGNMSALRRSLSEVIEA